MKSVNTMVIVLICNYSLVLWKKPKEVVELHEPKETNEVTKP